MYDAAAAAHANTPQTARISRQGREGISYPLMSASRAQAPVSNVRFGSGAETGPRHGRDTRPLRPAFI